MDYIELRCKISAEEIQTISEILIAELNEIAFESYEETSECFNSYILL